MERLDFMVLTFSMKKRRSNSCRGVAFFEIIMLSLQPIKNTYFLAQVVELVDTPA